MDESYMWPWQYGWWTLIANLILWAIFFGGATYMIGLREIPVEDQANGEAPKAEETGSVEPQ